jgi:hypothetical protein
MQKYFVERIHNLMTEFIYRMPEKIKDLKLRNEEYFNRADEHVSQTVDMSAYFYNTMGSYSSYQHNYIHHTQHHNPIQNRITPLTSYHDFEDFLNLV